MLHITIQNMKLSRNIATVSSLVSLESILYQICSFLVKCYELVIQKDKMRQSDFHLKVYDLIKSV